MEFYKTDAGSSSQTLSAESSYGNVRKSHVNGMKRARYGTHEGAGVAWLVVERPLRHRPRPVQPDHGSAVRGPAKVFQCDGDGADRVGSFRGQLLTLLPLRLFVRRGLVPHDPFCHQSGNNTRSPDRHPSPSGPSCAAWRKASRRWPPPLARLQTGRWCAQTQPGPVYAPPWSECGHTFPPLHQVWNFPIDATFRSTCPHGW